MKKRVGLLAVGGSDWMGGLYYIHNLIKALHYLPEAERPEIVLFAPQQHMEHNYHQDIMSLVDEIHVLPPRYERLTFNWFKFHITHRMTGIYVKPYILQKAAKAANVQVVFPIMDTPGKAFQFPWIAWIPDLQHKYYPENFDSKEIIERDTLYPQMIRDASHMVMSSHAAWSDLEKYYDVPDGKVSALQFRSVPEDTWYTDSPDEIIKKYRLPRRFILIANQFWKHKNHIVAFKALRLAAQELDDIAFVCTGSPQDYRNPEYFQQLQEFIDDEGLKKHLHVLGLVPARDRLQLFRAAAAILQPSLFEGWSTVVEEARAFGKKVFLSNIPVQLEQNPPGSVFFDPHDAEQLSRLLIEHWPTLAGGVHHEAEQQAREQQKILIADYARTFVKIMGIVEQ